MENKTAEDELIIETSDTLNGQTFNIEVYKSKVIVTRRGGKEIGTRTYINALQCAEMKKENERLKAIVAAPAELRKQVAEQQKRIEELEAMLHLVRQEIKDGPYHYCANQIQKILTPHDTINKP